MADAPEGVLKLVEKFDRHRDAYKRGRYNETMVRREFIDPFFIELGWDVDNRAGYAEAYKDVIHEDMIKAGAPDYCFRIGGARKFFVEAKKPSLDIAGDPGPAYQLRRYAWSAKLALSVLTDFEEFALYDCRVRPKQTDKPAAARVRYLTYDKYADKWDEVAAILSKDAVLQGSFDRFVATGKKRGTAEVDSEFLKEIEKWRETLARNIALRNLPLGVRELNFAVQRTIDRIIFLRMCEDRGIEAAMPLRALRNGANVYQRLMRLFADADHRYNSGLFHFTREKDRGEPDQITPELAIDDKVLKDIFKSLYYPESPYEFSVLPPDILGNVYEQFLGKVIHLTAGHRARVEEKPEVKKAGGVYYTPKYIVDYIVEQTVGRLIGAAPPPTEGEGKGEGDDQARLSDSFDTSHPDPLPQGERENGSRNMDPQVPHVKGKTPRQISRLKILDPACGSGSFLVGAYRRLLDYHRDWYVEAGAEKHRKRIYQGAGGQWILTTEEKKRILLNNIFGVDIDPQAVEVTKLNLLLCVLENENQQTLTRQMALFRHKRALPDLSSNIKCGNSLIGPDFYEGRQTALFDEEEILRINAFDWETEFPEIMSQTRQSPRGDGGKRGGFDCVIGNPPYIDIIGIPKAQRNYFDQRYETFLYRTDIAGVFFERAISLLKREGRLGFITTNTYLTSVSARKLRAYMTSCLCIDEIVDIGGGVFLGANVDTAVFVARRAKAPQGHTVQLATCRTPNDFPKTLGEHIRSAYPIEQEELTLNADKFFLIAANADVYAAVQRVKRAGEVGLGEVLEFSRGYIAYDAHRGHSKKTIKNRVFHSDRKLGPTYKKELVGSDIARYALDVKSQYWIKFGDNLAAPRDSRFHVGPRIWIQRIRNPKLPQRLVCFYTASHADLAASSGLTIARSIDARYSACGLCGLLNSRLVNWWYRQMFHDVNIKPVDMVTIPVPRNWLASQDGMEILVERMLELHKKLAEAKTDHARKAIQRRIDATDKQIDQLVYELYELTDEEIGIVEGKM